MTRTCIEFTKALVAGISLLLLTAQGALAAEAAAAAAPPNPKLVKLPFAVGGQTMENTPVVFQGRPLLVDNDRPGHAHAKGENATLRITDLTTGQEIARFGKGHSFVSAFVNGPELNVFATEFNDFGVKMDTICINRFSSTDLKSWKQETVLTRQGNEQFFNTSVCRDDEGYLMAYESDVPVRWCFRFARSKDLSHWERIPNLDFADVEGKSACANPTLCYFAPYYYVIYGVWCFQERPWKCYEYVLPTTKYTTVVARSKDLVTWEVSPTRGPMLDPAIGEGVNNTDADLFEYEGNTYIYYATGDQATWGTIRVAMYAGPMQQMLEAYFPAGVPTITFDAKQRKYIDPSPAACLPSSRQLAYQEKQLGAFAHFGLPTYARDDAEYNAVFPFNPGAVPDPSRFNPEKLDAEQWVLAAKSFGAKHFVFPAKHHDGFCLWPTKTTDYSVRNTPWKNGQGDVVREVAEACKKHGMPMGIYCSPADKHLGCYVNPRDHFKLVGDREAYFRVYQEQLRELLTGYGEMVMVWFDNYCDPFSYDTTDPATGQRIGHGRYDEALVSLVRELQPNAVVLRYRSARSDLRAVGNEDGSSPYPIWNVLRKGEGVNHPELLSPEAEGWYFCESDIPTRPSWIWRPNSDDKLHSVDRLVKAYTDSIGHGANILINLTPDPSGLIPEAEVQRLADFGAELNRRFGSPLARTDSRQWTKPGELELALPRKATLAYVVLEEDLAQGQHVLQYAIDAQVDGAWKEVAGGESIGRKRIQPLEPSVVTDRIRLRVLKADGIPVIRELVALESTR